MFLDTSGLLCALDRGQSAHAQATTAFDGMQRGLTHNYVAAEFVALTLARRIPRMLSLQFISELAFHPRVEFVWVDVDLHRRAMALLLAQLDKKYSLCDAVSFVLMRERNIDEVLSLDQDFEVAGFQRVLR